MSLLLEDKGVYELTRKDAFGEYFGEKHYCIEKTYDEKVIVNYFKNKQGVIIKTILEDYLGKDFLNVYFSSEDKVNNKECLEAIIRSLCLRANNDEFIRRTESKELIVKINLLNYMSSKFHEFLIDNAYFEDLGYYGLKRENVRSGNMTEYEQEKLLTELKEHEKYSKKLYEKQNHNHLSWDEYFMASAVLTSMRSKDPSTKVGATIVNEDNIKLSEGYNGTPNGWKDSEFPWSREGEHLETKYPYVVHSEANAITHCIGQGISLHGSRIYVTLFPCNECAKLIVQSGINEVIYLSDKYDGTEDNIAAKRIFDECGVSYKQLLPDKEVTLKLKL